MHNQPPDNTRNRRRAMRLLGRTLELMRIFVPGTKLVVGSTKGSGYAPCVRLIGEEGAVVLIDKNTESVFRHEQDALEAARKMAERVDQQLRMCLRKANIIEDREV